MVVKINGGGVIKTKLQPHLLIVMVIVDGNLGEIVGVPFLVIGEVVIVRF